MTASREQILRRLDVLWVLTYVSAAALLLRLLQVQVIQNARYAEAAERNRTQVLRQTAPRGRIYDRNGEVIAANQAIFSLIYVPGARRDEAALAGLARRLAPELHKDPGQILLTLHRAAAEESAIRLAEKLPPKVMFKLSELRTLYPGVNLAVEARRYYPRGAFAAHLLGYLGKMDETGWTLLKNKGYRIDSWVGKSGIERLYEPDLRGRDGGIRMEVDARGRLKRVMKERIAWKPGSNLYLTIDAGFQKAAEDALRSSPSKSGAVVAVDPENGNILALASIPDFDPNAFLQSNDEGKSGRVRSFPEFNLATQGLYAPGSTFKIVSGSAMLNERTIDPARKEFCPGYFELGQRVFRCWDHKGHGWQDWVGGLTHSCDVYFYKTGLKTGGDLIEKYEEIFHLGQRTRVGLPGEAAGRTSGPGAWRARGMHWHDGNTVNLSIGQGDLLVTPIQMAVLMAAVANRGTLWRPHFLSRIEYLDGRPDYVQKPEVLGHVDLKASTWDLLARGLASVVREGTGAGAQTPGLVVWGKTGTAQNPNGKDHAWFVAFAKREGDPRPTLAVAVLVQHGGHAPTAAVPVAKKVIQAAFHIG